MNARVRLRTWSANRRFAAICRRAGAGLALCALLATAGCRTKQEREPDFVHSDAERGPLKLTVEVRPKQVWIGDPIVVTVNFHTPDGYHAQLPAASDLGKLQVDHVDSPDAQPAPEGGLRWRRSFTIASMVSGALEIPALVVKYGRAAPADTQPALDSEMVSDALKIEVRSALTTQDSIAQPRDITGTLVPARTLWQAARWWIIGGAAAVAALLVVALLWRHWLKQQRVRPPVLPEVWALQALAELAGGGWLAVGRAREFYYRMSEIVRGYIETKFGLAAPEMTTEEFLSALARNEATLPYEADRLRVFLEACDIVKYAAFKPRAEDGEQALGAARAFVYETAAAVERVAQKAREPRHAGETSSSGGHAA